MIKINIPKNEVDCDKCKERDGECRPNYDRTCENFELDCHLCANRFAFCMCPQGEYCDGFEFTTSEDDYETALRKLKAGIIRGDKDE